MQGEDRRIHGAQRALLALAGATLGLTALLLMNATAAGADEVVSEPTFEGVPLSLAALPAAETPTPVPVAVTASAATAEIPDVRAAEVSSEPTFNGVPLSQALPPAPTRSAPAAVEAPPLPGVRGGNRHIVYSVRQQRVWLVEDGGEISKSYLVSGRAGLPRVGTYNVFSKSERASSGSVTMRHMIRFARGRNLAIGFHSIPVRRNGTPIQSLAQLGTYRSHGCVRQAPSDAEHLWRWAPVGTRVVVTS